MAYLAYISQVTLLLREVQPEAQGRNLESVTEEAAMEENLSGLLSMASTACFFISPRITHPGVVSYTMT